MISSVRYFTLLLKASTFWLEPSGLLMIIIIFYVITEVSDFYIVL